MKFLKIIVPILLVFQIAVFAKGFKKTKVVSFATENCKTIGKNPLVTVCIESATDKAKYSKRLGKAFKSTVKDLVKTYDPNSSSSLINTRSTCDPGYYGENEENDYGENEENDYGEGYYGYGTGFDQAACDADPCCLDEETSIGCTGESDWSVACCGYEYYDEGGY